MKTATKRETGNPLRLTIRRMFRSKMVARNFSQLAVINEDGVLHGAVSWESIGMAAMAGQITKVSEASAPARVTAADLTIGDYVYLLREPGSWLKFTWPLDHAFFLEQMNKRVLLETS